MVGGSYAAHGCARVRVSPRLFLYGEAANRHACAVRVRGCLCTCLCIDRCTQRALHMAASVAPAAQRNAACALPAATAGPARRVTACDLVLEYTLSAAAVAKGFTAYTAALIGVPVKYLRLKASAAWA